MINSCARVYEFIIAPRIYNVSVCTTVCYYAKTHFQYPHGIEDMVYDPDFAIRGLHCDISRGLLMKIDAYNHIHLSSVHR